MKFRITLINKTKHLSHINIEELNDVGEVVDTTYLSISSSTNGEDICFGYEKDDHESCISKPSWFPLAPVQTNFPIKFLAGNIMKFMGRAKTLDEHIELFKEYVEGLRYNKISDN